MASNELAKLYVALEAQTAEFTKQMDGVNQKLDGFGKKGQQVTDTLKKSFVALGAVVTSGAFAAIVKGSLDSADRLGDLSVRLGTTVEGLSRLDYAAKLTGVSSNTLTTGLQRMTRRVAEAAQGTGEAVKALGELGLSAEKLNTLRPEQQFEVLADALNEVQNPADKVRLSMKLLDSEGVALLQTMEGGSAAIRELGRQSDATGSTISTKFAQDASAANDAIDTITASSVGLINSLVAGLAPSIKSVADFMTDSIPVAAEFVSGTMNTLRGVLVSFAADVVSFVEKTAGTLGVLAENFGFDEVGQSLLNTAAGYRTLAVELDDLAVVYDKFNDSDMPEFAPTLGDNVVNIKDFRKELFETNALIDGLPKDGDQRLSDKANNVLQGNFDKARKDYQGQFDTTGRAAEFDRFSENTQSIEAFGEANPALVEAGTIHQALEDEKRRHMSVLADITARGEEAQRQSMEQAEKDRNKLAQQEMDDRFSIAQGMFGNLSTLMNSENKKLFKIGKVAAIANATVHGIEAAVSSFKFGADIGGPILGAAFAATSLAATGVQIAQLKSQQFGGGGTVSTGFSGGTPNTYQPPQPTQPVGPQGPGAEGQGAVNIVLSGNFTGDPKLWAEAIAPHLGEVIKNRDIIIIDNESRNGQNLRDQAA